ncbi:hypothetical protein [Alteromonas lipolytica]|nr:hypothetical protein [Alteromonas lipolytica]
MKLLKINETTIHYLTIFGFFALMIVFAFIGWQLVEHTQWFAEFWQIKRNRLMLLIGLAAGSVWLLVYGYSYFWGTKKLIRTFKAIEQKNIADCQSGETVRLQGEVVLLKTALSAPFTQRDCAAYTLKISEKVERVRANGHTETAWETSKFFAASTDFLIRYKSHYALARVQAANIVIQPDTVHDDSTYHRDSGGFLSDTENTKRQQTLEAVGESFRRFTGVYGADVKFEEGVLEAGEEVVVLGTGHWKDTGNTDDETMHYLASQSIKTLFVIESTVQQSVSISDSTALLKALN